MKDKTGDPSPQLHQADDRDSVRVEPPGEHTGIRLGKPKQKAAGLAAVLSSFKHVFGQAGLTKGAAAMGKLNQTNGFDCPSCAWPDPDDERASTEFCENGAKALASETTQRRVTPEFFARHTVAELSRKSDHWMEQQGRLTHPMIKRVGASHYEPISWNEAFSLLASELTALSDPNEAVFYTSGRTVNEAAFLYQLFVRKFGTNNLPDCSNMCHESSGAALQASLGVGKGTVTLEDIRRADALLIVGQNPGTNHPRMLSALQEAAREGAEIVSVNPMKEAGLVGFAHPQEIRGMMGQATPLACDFLPVKINGDQALFVGIGKALLEREAKEPGSVIDAGFIALHTRDFPAYRARVAEVGWGEIVARSGIEESAIRRTAARFLRGEKRVITCWAMGLTQHRNAVATIREVVNVHLLIGAIGREGAGLCPVRGHSNVQGDRTMGIFEKMPGAFHDALDREFGFESPREPGWDVVQAIKAMHDGRGRIFFAMGGNFLQASPDTGFTAEALQRCRLTAHVATKLNRSHLVTGEIGLILPCLGRSEIDRDDAGNLQFATVENSMSVVHQTRGTFEPASEALLSETRIVARLASATLGRSCEIDFDYLGGSCDRVRDRIEAVVPGFERFNQRVREPGGFYLPNAAQERCFETPSGRAEFGLSDLTSTDLADGELMLMTVRSHDQFNTTIYGLNDRYRGISKERRILFMNPRDMAERGLKPLTEIDIFGTSGDRDRVVHRFLAVPYEIPRRAVSGYFPELNPLVPIDLVAEISNTPCSKSIPVQVVPSEGPTPVSADLKRGDLTTAG